jgi:hypothetical protein
MKKILTYRSDEAMNSNGNFPQKNYFHSKAKNIVVFAFIYVLESFALFYGYFCMDKYSVDIDEAMKRGD